MSFVGLVTQKEEVTGVKLMAKIVTENKKKSTKKIFPVRVKASKLSDASCCVVDLTTVVDKINNSQDLSQIIADLVLSYSGENGTTISYKIIDGGSPYLSTYLGADGKLFGRPKYGEGNASGTLEVTVSKGKESITSNIQVSVKEYIALEVLNDVTLSKSGLWSLIKNTNDSYTNIANNLNLVTTRTITDKSLDPVSIEWVVEDTTLEYTDLYSAPRIDKTTGEITRPTYKEACTLLDAQIPGVEVTIVGTSNTANLNRIRIGGLILRAKLTLGEEQTSIVYNCSTLSKYITGAEILKVVQDNLEITTLNSAAVYEYRGIHPEKPGNADKVNIIKAPANGGVYTLRVFGDAGSETFKSDELNLQVGDITHVRITNSVRSFDNSESLYQTDVDAALYITAFGDGFNTQDDTYNTLTIDFDAIKDADEDKKKFVIKSEVAIESYSGNGATYTSGRIDEQFNAYFIIDTSEMTTSEPTTEE
jgi:hypothetical protein